VSRKGVNVDVSATRVTRGTITLDRFALLEALHRALPDEIPDPRETTLTITMRDGYDEIRDPDEVAISFSREEPIE
jgi:hypothetical protein